MGGQFYKLSCYYDTKKGQQLQDAELEVNEGCVVLQRILTKVPSSSYTKVRGVNGIITMAYSVAIGQQAMHYSWSTSNFISMMFPVAGSAETIFSYNMSDHLMTTIDLPPREYNYVNIYEYLVNSGYYFSQMMIIPTKTYLSTIVASNTLVIMQSQLFVLKYGKYQKHFLTIESDVSKELLKSSSVMYFKMVKSSCERLQFPYINASIWKVTHNKSSKLYTVFQLLDAPIYMAFNEQNYVEFTYVINSSCHIHLKYHTEYLKVNNIRSCNQKKVFL